jgi:hypothetical protein
MGERGLGNSNSNDNGDGKSNGSEGNLASPDSYNTGGG